MTLGPRSCTSSLVLGDEGQTLGTWGYALLSGKAVHWPGPWPIGSKRNIHFCKAQSFKWCLFNNFKGHVLTWCLFKIWWKDIRGTTLKARHWEKERREPILCLCSPTHGLRRSSPVALAYCRGIHAPWCWNPAQCLSPAHEEDIGSMASGKCGRRIHGQLKEWNPTWFESWLSQAPWEVWLEDGKRREPSPHKGELCFLLWVWGSSGCTPGCVCKCTFTCQLPARVASDLIPNKLLSVSSVTLPSTQLTVFTAGWPAQPAGLQRQGAVI